MLSHMQLQDIQTRILTLKNKSVEIFQKLKGAFKLKSQQFEEFYPFYLSQHLDRTNKILHFIGTVCAVSSLAWIIESGEWVFILVPFVFGYAPAWVGHFFFEKNKPATFQYPFLSFISDFVMFWHLATGRLKFDTGSRLKRFNETTHE